MKKRITYVILTCLFFGTSCSVRKHLPPGEKLYNGATINVQREPGVDRGSKAYKRELKTIVTPIKNKMIFGFPYKVWFWYKIGETKKQRGLKYWLRNKLGEEPVLSSRVRPGFTAQNMQAYLENEGYFESEVKGDTIVKGYKVNAVYDVDVARPYLISAVEWKVDSSELAKAILTTDPQRSLLKKGDRYDLDNITGERERVDLQLKEKGFYFFNPYYIMTYADTNHKDFTVSLFLSIKPVAPPKARFAQKIKDILVYPRYSVTRPPADTLSMPEDTLEQIRIRDTVQAFKPTVFTRAILFRKGEYYSISEQNKTLNRLSNLNIFRFVKNRFEEAGSSDTSHSLNVYYYLTPLRQKTIQFEIGGFTKTNSFVGGQVNATWKHRNIFRGAESFNIRTYAAVEISLSDSLRQNNNFRLGGEASLIIPKFIVPFRMRREQHAYPPRTRFLLGYERLRRQNLYSKNYFRVQYELNWKETLEKEHTLAPISILYNDIKNTSPQFLYTVSTNPELRFVNLPEIITSAFYNFLRTTVNPNTANMFYMNFNVEMAGTLVGLFNKTTVPLSKKVFDAYFAQYFKADMEFRYTKRLGKQTYWANRFMVGASLPYGNSAYLPFSKQFIIGGANSLRGFRPRGIGPGSSRATALQQGYYPQVGGDYKLEMNTELRLPLFQKVNTAVFIDAGNIWMKDSLLYGKEGKLSGNFLNEIAVDAGIGLRFDASILVLRFDVAAPLRKPWLPSKERSTVDQIDLNSKAWRKENLVFNLAIGYPF